MSVISTDSLGPLELRHRLALLEAEKLRTDARTRIWQMVGIQLASLVCIAVLLSTFADALGFKRSWLDLIQDWTGVTLLLACVAVALAAVLRSWVLRMQVEARLLLDRSGRHQDNVASSAKS